MVDWRDQGGQDASFVIEGAERPGRWIITCDHATARVPAQVDPSGTLGLPASDLARHIAYDIGALGVARALGEALGSPVVSSNFSRLVIDPNRGADDPTLIMQLYGGSIIPGNRRVDAEERERRLDAYYRPYDAALSAAYAARPEAAVVSIHSFTPQLAGRPPRPWQVGVLFADDARLSLPFVEALERDTDLTIGVNEPYIGHLPGDAIDRHALKLGRQNTLVELRNDLIATPEAQRRWAAYLAPKLEAALDAAT